MDILKEVGLSTYMSIVVRIDLQVFRPDDMNQTVQLQKFEFNESLTGYALYDSFMILNILNIDVFWKVGKHCVKQSSYFRIEFRMLRIAESI